MDILESLFPDCPYGTILNPSSMRCVDSRSPTGILIRSVLSSDQDLYKNCPCGYIKNPVDGICVSEKSTNGEIISIIYNGEFPNPEDYIYNGINQYVNMFGKASEKVLGKWNCRRYGERSPNYQFTPTDNQLAISKFFVNLPSKYNGVLLYWTLGTGKTCGASLMIDQYLEVNQNIQRIYVITSGSLRNNFLYQYCMICGSNPDEIKSRFHFISYNYSKLLEKLPEKDELENSIVIIDEVHNVTNGVVNESENMTFLYNLLRSVTNIKFILLSGTPVTRDVLELYYILKLINRLDTPDDPEKFKQDYYDKEDEIFIPKDKLLDLIAPVISHVGITEEMKSFYPKEYQQFITIPMVPRQSDKYEMIQDEERQIKRQGVNENLKASPETILMYKESKTRWYLAVSMLRSRQIGNMIYPESIEPEISGFNKKQALVEIIDIIKKTVSVQSIADTIIENVEDIPTETFRNYSINEIPNIIGNVISTQMKGILSDEDIKVLINNIGQVKLCHQCNVSCDKLISDGGWITKDFIRNLPKYSPKFTILLYLIANMIGKHVVYSQFKNRFGIHLIGALLKYYGISYLMFTGDLNDRQRNEVVRLYNHPDNINGKYYKVLLITEAGSEGNNFLGTNVIHILEQSIDENTIKQVQGRVIRYQSHLQLPPERRYVIVIRYFAITDGPLIDYKEMTQTPDRQTSDYFAYKLGIKKLDSIKPTIDMLNQLPAVPLGSTQGSGIIRSYLYS